MFMDKNLHPGFTILEKHTTNFEFTTLEKYTFFFKTFFQTAAESYAVKTDAFYETSTPRAHFFFLLKNWQRNF